jgi:AraC-like DNA-binding protein
MKLTVTLFVVLAATLLSGLYAWRLMDYRSDAREKTRLLATRLEGLSLFHSSLVAGLPEISYLLGFRDTSSFFRAFQGWTGMTPGDYRALETTPRVGPLH